MRFLGSILLLLSCSCGPTPEEWALALDAPDPFDRFLAAVALISHDGPVPDRAVQALLLATNEPDPALRRTAHRLLRSRPDQAARCLFTLLDTSRRAPRGSRMVWSGSPFELELLARLAPYLRHPECDAHGELCGFVATLATRERKDLIRLSERVAESVPPTLEGGR